MVQSVDHPDAASLPLGLTVALLKDADGVIRIDLPVEGDINDPEGKPVLDDHHLP